MKILHVPSGGVVELDQIAPHDTLPRCKAALQLWQTGRYDKIIVSGGIFLPPELQTIPAAVLMKEWFVQNGIDEKKILVEDQSLDTYQNAEFTASILEIQRAQDAEVTIVTQWQHARRLARTLKKYGVNTQIHPLNYKIGFKTWVLEWAFMFIHLIDPKGTWFLGRINRRKRNQKTPSA